MGTLDKLGDVAADIITDIVADKAVDLARYLANKLFGDEADDGIAAAIARGALDGAAAAAALKAQERAAAAALPDKWRETFAAIASIDVDALFVATSRHAGPQEVVIEEPNREGPWRTLDEERADNTKEK